MSWQSTKIKEQKPTQQCVELLDERRIDFACLMIKVFNKGLTDF